MGRLADWWQRLSGRGSRPAAFRPPPGARFTEIGTNYPGAGSTARSTWSAPNPYSGYSATPSGPSAQPRAPRRDASAPPAWGTPSGAPPTPAGPTVAGAPAYLGPGHPSPYVATGTLPGRPRSGRRALTGVTFGAVAAVVVVAVVVAIGLLAGASDGSGSNPFGGGSAPDMDTAWSVDSYDLSDYGTFDSADGTVPGTVLSTSHGWIAMVEPSTLEALLVSVDPDSGSVQWSTPVPEGRCTTTTPDSILCLVRDGAPEFQLLTLAADTGERVGEPVPTDLTHVPVLVVPMGGDAVVTLSISSELAAVDLQGTTLWTQPIDVGDYEVEWLEIDTAAYDASVILHLGGYVGTVQATAEGATLHDCRGVAVTPQAWMCQGEDDAVGLSPDGTELWRADWEDYYVVDQYEHIAPVMIVDNWDGTVSAVDPLTGDHGAAIDLGTDSSFNLLGDAEHPVVLTDDSVVMLDAELTTVLWTAPIRDEYLNIAGGGVIGETLVVDGEQNWGFDVGTGEERWQRDFLPYDVLVLDDALVGVRINELVRYELP